MRLRRRLTLALLATACAAVALPASARAPVAPSSALKPPPVQPPRPHAEPPKPARVATDGAGPSCPAPVEAAAGELRDSVAAGESRCYAVHVTGSPSDLTVKLAGPSGRTADLDLYVRYGEAPSATAYDCRPFTALSTEECRFADPKTGEWYVIVHAAGTGGDYALSIAFGACAALAPGEPFAGQLTAEGASDCAQVNVPSGIAFLRVQLRGASGASDLDLFVGRGSPPSAVSYECASQSLTDVEQCVVYRPEAGTWFITVTAFSRSDSYTLLATLDAFGCDAVDPGVDITGDATRAFDSCYRIAVADQDLLRVTLAGAADADLDLYVSRSEDLGDTQAYACTSTSFSATERCGVPGPDAGAWYVHVVAFSVPGSGAFTMRAELSEAVPISDTLTPVALEGTGDVALFRLPSNRSAAVVSLVGVGPDFDLYTARGRIPSLGGADCASESVTSVEACAHLPGEGDVYVLVLSYLGDGSARLAALSLS